MRDQTVMLLMEELFSSAYSWAVVLLAISCFNSLSHFSGMAFAMACVLLFSIAQHLL